MWRVVVALALGLLFVREASAQEEEAPDRLRWPPPPAWGYPDAQPDDEPPALDERATLEPAPRSSPPPPPRDEDLRWYPRTLNCRVKLSVHLLPVLDVVADQDPLEPGDGILFRADVKAAPGLAAAIGFGQSDGPGSLSIGGYYHVSRHDERKQGGEVDVHGGYLELQFDAGVPEEGPVRLVIGGALGVGAMVIDFTRGPPGAGTRPAGRGTTGRGRVRTFHDTGGAAFEARAHVGLRLFEHLEAEAGAGYFCWGWDDEAVGHGGYLSLGATLRF